MNTLDQGEVDALEELRSANDTITALLQSDFLILQGEHKSLRTDYEQQKTQLNEALLAKDKALVDLANLRDMVNINDQVLYEKSQSEKKLKEDKNRNELNEVSRRSGGAQKAPQSHRKSFFSWTSVKSATKPIRTSLHIPSVLKHQPVRPRPVTINLTAQQAQDDELMRELAAIGASPISPLSPRSIPASPLPQPPKSVIRQRHE